MPFFRARPFVLLVVCLSSASAWAAELRLRKSLLEQQQDRVTITITAVADHIGDSPHPILEDCDLHVPLRTDDIRVSVLGELKNACSTPPADGATSWTERIYRETHGRAVPVTGVFRIWLEHPPSGSTIQSEDDRVPWYDNSNPDHQVELHPLLRIGGLDFFAHIRRIEENGEAFENLYGPSKLKTVLKKKITIQEIASGSDVLVDIRGKKTVYNHWGLRGRVVSPPAQLADGTRILLDVFDGTNVIPGATNIPAVTATGTDADGAVQDLHVGDFVNFQALIRMDLVTVLEHASVQPEEIGQPFEFVLLDVQKE